MNYNITEIQDSWKPKIGDRVKERNNIHEGFIVDIGVKSFGIKFDGIIDIYYDTKEDLIWQPSIEDLLELMGIKNNEDMGRIISKFVDDGISTKHFTEEDWLKIETKETFVHLFMFTKGKILKNGKWEAI